jgi:lysophospholipase L1-like esterase
MQETLSASYLRRTAWNMRDSDATFIFTMTDRLGGGSKRTATFADSLNKPSLYIRPGMHPKYVARFLIRHAVKTLNVAGKRESSAPGIGDLVRQVLSQAVRTGRLAPTSRSPATRRSLSRRWSTISRPLMKKAHMVHSVLLGDSVSDNGPYVSAGLEVQAQLQSLLGGQHRVSLLAQDGSVLEDIAAQLVCLQHLPVPDWLIVSCGGNDVLELVGAMQSKVGSVLEATELLAGWQAGFRRAYRDMLDLVLAPGIPVAVATIYDAVPGLAAGLRTALAPFNDVIVRDAAQRRLPLLDLRLVCTDGSDYAASSPIEPSASGGRKIAGAIAQLLRDQPRAAPRTLIYGA